MLLANPALSRAAESDVVGTPVPVVVKGRLPIPTPTGNFELPVETSRNWDEPQEDITRAIIVIHGWPRRDLGAGKEAMKKAGDSARDAILITPQFLAAQDIAAHQLAPTVLRWLPNDWQRGRPSDDAAQLSSFEAIDAIFRKLGDRQRFPHLKTIVLAGHSAGGQLVQRYVAFGRGAGEAEAAGLHVRYLVANPSSYLYFTPDRPNAAGGFSPFNAASCLKFDDWHHGMAHGAPAYAASFTPQQALAAYLRQDIVYLLGTADNNPSSDALDKSCAGEAQGPTRYARGLAYEAYVRWLDPATRQQRLEVPGVAHNSHAMLSSVCALSAMFDKPGCPGAK